MTAKEDIGEGVRCQVSGVGEDLSNIQHPTPDTSPLLPSAPTVEAVLTANIASDAGKEDYVRVRLHYDGEPGSSAGHWLAEPVLGKSALIATMVVPSALTAWHPMQVGFASVPPGPASGVDLAPLPIGRRVM